MTDLRAWGVEPAYWDIWGNRREAPSEALDRIRAALEASGEPVESGPLFARPGERRAVPEGSRVVTEDGGDEVVADGRLPADLPLGYHRLRRADGETQLVVSPGTCFLPDDLRIWAWSVQVYALRSRASWGIGDLADLRRFASMGAELGAGACLVNPLHAASADQTSPYSPSSRLYRNPLYLRIEELPGAPEAGLGDLAAAARSRNDQRVIDRIAVGTVKRTAFERVWGRFKGDPGFDAYRAREDPVLERFATHIVLGRRFGTAWRSWPAEYRRPESPAVERFAAAHRDAVDLEKFLQWQLDVQLGRAGRVLPVVGDLAVGVDPQGADAWLFQDAIADGISIGAPPDDFNLGGQNWGVVPFDPHRLRRQAYGPFVRTIRSAMQHAGGLRYDHVMGLFRLFWVPDGMTPAAGTYVRYPAHDLLELIALESHRAGCVVVGEDLGTVEEGVREELARRRMLSYRVLWFEPHPPRDYPELALAGITNHDLPTVAGVWTGADLADQRRAGVEPNEDGARSARERLCYAAGLAPDASVEEAIEAAHRALSEAPSRIVAATLEDALGVAERPNLPGTTGARRPNWSLALPRPLEDIEAHSGVRRVAAILGRGRVGSDGESTAQPPTS